MSRRIIAIMLILTVIVVLRSLIFFTHGFIFFDSDQALYGLMAKDLAMFRGFPLTFYGQKYLLALETWVTAPFFWFMQTSIATLRLPLLIMNVAACVWMFFVLAKETKINPWISALATSFIALPAFPVTSNFMAAYGADIEPFLFILAIWVLKDRPVWLGIVTGVGYFNREFVIFGFLALLVLDALKLELRLKRVWQARAVSLLSGFVTFHSLKGLGHFATGYVGAGTPRPPLGPVGDNLRGFLSVNFPSLMGFTNFPLDSFSIHSGERVSIFPIGLCLGLVFVLLVVAGAVIAVRNRERLAIDPKFHFPIFLILVSLGQAVMFIAFFDNPHEMTLVRYTLLTLLFPVGWLAILYLLSASRLAKACIGSFLIAWTLNSAFANALVNLEYIKSAPRDSYRELADVLLSKGFRYGRADYWIAYYVTFLTDEDLIVQATESKRIERYEDILKEHGDEVFSIYKAAAQCENEQFIGRYFVCPAKRR